jgi:type IV secretory pathway VirB4 component
METFVSKMRKLPKETRKMILIEEAWKAIAREGMAEYIKYLFKTVRKYFGEALVVTQDIEDIISSPVVKQAIINNSDCKILLDQRKYQNDFPKIQQLCWASPIKKPRSS